MISWVLSFFSGVPGAVIANAYFNWALLMMGTLSFYTFVVPFFVQAFLLPEQNLKRKYGAEWALVTGASSGIGRALTERLAGQGINVVMAALDEPLLDEAVAAMEELHPGVSFVRCGVNLAQDGYVETIVSACAEAGAEPTLIFNNAGYVATGMFADSALGRQMANYECNATAPVKITHHFLNEMLNNGKRGAVCFTSSPAGFIPAPMTTMYSATKSFLTSFAQSLAAEVKCDGVDVLVVHPSPVDTAFYAGNTHDIDAMKMFQKTAYPPTAVASCFFKSLGRFVVHDHGYFSLFSRLALKVADIAMLATLFSRTAQLSGDFTKTKAERPLFHHPPAGAASTSEPSRSASVSVSRSVSRSASVAVPAPRRRR